MHFLCIGHRKQLALQTNDKLHQLWWNWINQGAMYYDLEQWSEAVAYIGCAFDLSCLILAKNTANINNSATHITLSAIYLSNSFTQVHESNKADLTLTLGANILKAYDEHLHNQQTLSKCIDTLCNPIRQADFFHEHLNLPFQYSSEQKETVLH